MTTTNAEQSLEDRSDAELMQLRAVLEIEMKRRGLAFSVGNIGEQLILRHFNATSGLPILQLAPPGTKNVDALSRNGDRYSIKTLWKAKKTGTIYPDPQDERKRLFEFLVVAHLSDDLSLKTIHQFTWEQFLAVRRWDRRMSAWYVGCSQSALSQGHKLL